MEILLFEGFRIRVLILLVVYHFEEAVCEAKRSTVWGNSLDRVLMSKTDEQNAEHDENLFRGVSPVEQNRIMRTFCREPSDEYFLMSIF